MDERMILIRAVCSKQQTREFGFRGAGKAYLVAEGDVSSRSAYRMSSASSIAILLSETRGRGGLTVLRGQVGLNTMETLRSFAQQASLGFASRTYESMAAVVIFGDGKTMCRLPPGDEESAELFAAATVVEPPGLVAIRQLLRRADRGIWRRMGRIIPAENECVPLLWGGSFALHCLYTTGEIQDGLVRVIGGCVTIGEADAFGEGSRIPAQFIFGAGG